MDHQGLDIGHIGEKGENFQTIDKRLCVLRAALDLKGENGAAAVREVLFIQFMVWAVRKGRMIDFFHIGMVFEELDDLERIFHMALNAQGERLQSLQKQEGVEWA
ncbi:hypothetical protein SDC9_182239 [bioreactor metagenome]|uniref:Uncharacterized protein n=1 Tax=bioreactor metagenome TaxID=1076179 RepID=A0A645H6X4_9ZZZZ